MITELINELEVRKEFSTFKAQYPQAYLAHIFSMHTPQTKPEFQLGYCIVDENKLVVFKFAPFEQLPPDKAFNDEKKINPLDISNIKITPNQAEETAFNFFKEKYSAETVTKVIMILQQLEKTMYNFTLVTMTFNICNIRIDANTGVLLSHEFKSIMNLRATDV